MIQDSWYTSLLTCPDCQASIALEKSSNILRCARCDFIDDSGRDLRPQKTKTVLFEFSRSIASAPIEVLTEIRLDSPEITYQGPNARRDSRALISALTSRVPTDGKILDLGCGPRDQVIPISHLGYSYVGVDYSSQAADFLADAHAIPFQNSSFDCILSYAVLEHLYNPYIVLKEVSRVLKPGGIFIGTVSQGEPYHESYFHMTPWGLVALISSFPSLRLEQLWPSNDTLKSLSRMGRYPRIIKLLLSQVEKLHQSLPILAPRKMKWSNYDKTIDRLYRAGSIGFLITKTQEFQLTG